MSTKHIAIFGANGKVGRLLVKQALTDGHQVTAFIHRHHDLPITPSLTIVKGDIHNPDDVQKALDGCDAVMSALSSWSGQKQDVLSVAMGNIVPVMQKQNISRIISLTGGEARAKGDSLSLVHRFAHTALGIVGSKVLRDGEKHIQILEQSELDWVVIRSPIMRSGLNYVYTLSSDRPLPWAVVNRQAVARAMLDQLTDDKLSQQAPYIH